MACSLKWVPGSIMPAAAPRQKKAHARGLLWHRCVAAGRWAPMDRTASPPLGVVMGLVDKMPQGPTRHPMCHVRALVATVALVALVHDVPQGAMTGMAVIPGSIPTQHERCCGLLRGASIAQWQSVSLVNRRPCAQSPVEAAWLVL